MITHIHSRGVTVNGETLTRNISATGGQEINLDEAIPENAATEVALALVAAKVKSLFITADKACVLETNDSATPADSFEMEAGGVIDWCDSDGTACPITVDVTSLFVTVPAAVGDVALIAKILVDPT